MILFRCQYVCSIGRSLPINHADAIPLLLLHAIFLSSMFCTYCLTFGICANVLQSDSGVYCTPSRMRASEQASGQASKRQKALSIRLPLRMLDPTSAASQSKLQPPARRPAGRAPPRPEPQRPPAGRMRTYAHPVYNDRSRPTWGL